MSKLTETVFELLRDGVSPDTLQEEFEKAVIESETGWALFGDGHWRRDTVCSICGLWVARICGHENDPNQKVILTSEYKKTHPQVK